MADKPLAGVVAFFSFRADETLSFKKTFLNNLTNIGARVTQRFGKDVTHVVVQKRFKPSPEQQVAEIADLRALHDKAAKVLQ